MEKQSLHTFMEYSDEKFTKRVIFNDGTSAIFVLNFKPGQSLPKHKHPGTNVFLHTLSGKGQYTIDSKEVLTEQGDVMICTGEEELSFTNNGSSNVSLYVMLNKLPSEQYAKDI